jgi:NADP-dependent 3-hydroxy acid dehydrogenase YdfG
MAQSVVVITGALTGISEATATAFAQRGDYCAQCYGDTVTHSVGLGRR